MVSSLCAGRCAPLANASDPTKQAVRTQFSLMSLRIGAAAQRLARAERLAGERRALDQRAQFRPGDLRMGATAEAAVRPGDDVLPAYQLRVPLQALRDEFGMFDHVGRMGDHEIG